MDLNLYVELRETRTKGTHEIAEELKKTRRLFERWTDHGHRGLKVANYNRDRYVAIENRPMHWMNAKNAHRKGGVRAVVRYVIREIVRREGLHDDGVPPPQLR